MTRAEYDRKRRLLAQREYNKRRSYDSSVRETRFETWYSDNFLVDLIFLDMVLSELGEEPTETQDQEQETNDDDESTATTSTDDAYDSGSDSSDYGSDGDSGD